MREDHAAGTRFARLRALPALRATAGALVLATAVTIIGTAAAGSTGKAGLITAVTTVAPDQSSAAVLAAARTHLGQKYVYGGDGPTTWDCSGFTSSLWRTVGGVATIPRTARLQQSWVTPVPAAQILPGDLYFVGTPATHVGLVVGGGMVLDASSSRGLVVLRALWTDKKITFGRVPRPGAVPVIPVATTPPTPTSPTTPPPTTTAPTTPPVAAPTTPPVATTAPVIPAPPTVVNGKPAAPTLAPSASRFVDAAEQLVGAAYGVGGTGPAYDDGALVAMSWQHAGGGLLPLDRNALAARSRPVAAKNLRAGDLVIYGTSNVWHVGIYVGKGMMVDASRIKGRVMLRPLLTSPDRHFGRVR